MFTFFYNLFDPNKVISIIIRILQIIPMYNMQNSFLYSGINSLIPIPQWDNIMNI